MNQNPPPRVSFEGLPGEEFAQRGIEDWSEGVGSEEALLMQIASRRLHRCGIDLPPLPQCEVDTEIQLYRLLQRSHGDSAYGRYNALLRRLVSFERALEQRWSRDVSA